jgi:hypothetical protein
MKLYTEEQVRNMLDTFILFTGNEDANDYIEYMTPIELPSDEEIKKEMGYDEFDPYHRAYFAGIGHMRDKINGGNNEQN